MFAQAQHGELCAEQSQDATMSSVAVSGLISFLSFISKSDALSGRLISIQIQCFPVQHNILSFDACNKKSTLSGFP